MIWNCSGLIEMPIAWKKVSGDLPIPIFRTPRKVTFVARNDRKSAISGTPTDAYFDNFVLIDIPYPTPDLSGNISYISMERQMGGGPIFHAMCREDEQVIISAVFIVLAGSLIVPDSGGPTPEIIVRNRDTGEIVCSREFPNGAMHEVLIPIGDVIEENKVMAPGQTLELEASHIGKDMLVIICWNTGPGGEV